MYQYLRIKILLFSAGRSFRKALIVSRRTTLSADQASARGSATHSASSSRTAPVSPLPLFRACSFSRRFRERFLVIFPKNAFRIFGIVGGMAFQARSHVSLTHSSVSSISPNMLYAILPQYRPYFASDSVTACSLRLKYSSMISRSSIDTLPQAACYNLL